MNVAERWGQLDTLLSPHLSSAGDLEILREVVSTRVSHGFLDRLVRREALPEWANSIDMVVSSVAQAGIHERRRVALLVFALALQVERLLGTRVDPEAIEIRGTVTWGVASSFQNVDREFSLDYFARAAQWFTRAGDPLSAAGPMLNQASVLYELGRASEALALVERARPAVYTYGSERHRAALDLTCANCLRSLARFEEALALYEAAEVVARRNLGHPEWAMNYGICIENHAGCLQQLGRHREALSLYSETEPLLARFGSQIQLAVCRMGHAGCLHDLRRHREAISILDELEPLVRVEGASIHYANLVHNRAVFLLDAGDVLEALAGFDRAEKLLAEVGTDMERLRCLSNRARCLAQLGRTGEARYLYEATLQRCRELGHGADNLLWRLDYRLAQLILQGGDGPEPAVEYVREALSTVERLGVNADRLENRVGLRESFASIYYLAVRVDLLMEDPVTAFHHAQQAKGRSLLDLMEERLQRSDDPLTVELQRLTGQEFEIIAQRERGTISAEESEAALYRARQARLEVVERLIEQRPDRALLLTGAVRELQDMQTALQDGEALVDMLDLGDDAALFLVTESDFHCFLVSGTQLSPLVERFRQEWSLAVSVLRYGTQREVETLHDLNDVLMVPMKNHLTGMKRLVLSPSGRFHQIPFAALSTLGDDGHTRYLSEEYELFTVPMATSLWLLRRDAHVLQRLPSLLAAAPFASETLPTQPPAPTALTSGSREWSAREGEDQLPYTGWEVEHVDELFASAHPGCRHELLKGPRAGLDAIRRAAVDAQFLLIATHGAPLVAESLADYALLFPDDALAGEIDLIRMREIYDGSLPLSQALVALTACHLGEVVLHGEEAMGFQQGLLAAGAKVALAPLWAVSDAATAVLSVAYHRGLLRDGLTAAEAMQRAMDEVRNTPGWEHPFFWAAMLPTGDGTSRLTSS